MKNTECSWLPEIISLKDFNGDFKKYFNYLYEIFKMDFLINQPLFKGLRVGARKNPEHNGKHEGFYHLTHKDFYNTGYENRQFDLRRSERLNWIKPIIQNYTCCKDCCNGIKIWKEKKKTHIFFEDELFVVVLEERKSYYVVVTAFYVDTRHNLINLLRRHDRYIRQKAH